MAAAKSASQATPKPEHHKTRHNQTPKTSQPQQTKANAQPKTKTQPTPKVQPKVTPKAQPQRRILNPKTHVAPTKPAITINAPAQVRFGQRIPVTIHLTNHGRPFAHQRVAIASSAGRLSATSAITNERGAVAVVVSRAPVGQVTVAAKAAKVHGSAQTHVIPRPKPALPWWLLLVAASVAGLLVSLIQRRRRQDDGHTPDSAE